MPLCRRKLQGNPRIPELQQVLVRTEENRQEIVGYVMPYLNSTLRQFMSDKTVRKDRAGQLMAILHDVAEAIAHMHRNNVSHLDLCDVNVMVQTSPSPLAPEKTIVRAALIDFGSAQLFGSEDAKYFSLVTENYLSRLIRVDREMGHVTYK